MLEQSQENSDVVMDQGSVAQVALSQTQLGLAAPGTGPLIQSGGYTKLAVGATNSVSGSIVVQRYLDIAGTIPQGAPLTQALSAGVAGVLNVTDGLPFLSFTVGITGSGTLTNVGALLQSV